MHRRWVVGFVVALVFVLSCKREQPLLVNFNPEVISTRVMEAFDRPAVGTAVDAFFEHVASGPAIEKRGDELLARFSADPKIMAAVSSLMERFVAAPEVQETIQKIMTEHPGVGEAELAELLGAHFSTNWDSPPVSAVWMAEWNTFSAKLGDDPELAGAFGRVIAPLLSGFDADRARTNRWNARLREIGGDDITSAQANTLYLERAWNPQRIENMLVQLVSNPTVRHASQKAFADILGIEVIVAELQRSSAQLLSTPELLDIASTLLELVYAIEPDVQQIQTQLHRLFAHPEVLATFRRLLKLVTTNPDAAKVGAAWLAEIKGDPALLRQLDQFFDTW